MERIKLALEKAKSRQSAVPAPAPVAAAEAPMASWPTAPVALLDESAEVQYVNTRVVELDPVHLETQRIVAFNKSHPANWAFDVLRTQVLQKMDQNGWRTLAITSPTLESGKSVVAINLAISIAHQTQRTAMLVDFDLRSPAIARYLGLPTQTSLNEVFDGSAQVADALVNPGLPRLVVLPTQRPVPKSSELLSSRKVGHIITDLRDRYQDRIVIFDLPPVLAADDVIAVLPRIDCVLMVIGSGMSSQKEIEDAMRHMGSANLLGVALNKDEAPVRKGYY
jgi:capsular exopolysaccharide synthesis family protein